MACTDQTDLIDFWTNFAWFDGVNCFYADQLGQGVIAFIFFGVTAFSLYNSTGSLVPSAVIAIITGGVVFAVLPAAGIEVALLIIVMAVSAGVYLLWKRASLQ